MARSQNHQLYPQQSEYCGSGPQQEQLLRLPPELIERFMRLLPSKGLLALASTCRALHPFAIKYLYQAVRYSQKLQFTESDCSCIVASALPCLPSPVQQVKVLNLSCFIETVLKSPVLRSLVRFIYIKWSDRVCTRNVSQASSISKLIMEIQPRLLCVSLPDIRSGLASYSGMSLTDVNITMHHSKDFKYDRKSGLEQLAIIFGITTLKTVIIHDWAGSSQLKSDRELRDRRQAAYNQLDHWSSVERLSIETRESPQLDLQIICSWQKALRGFWIRFQAPSSHSPQPVIYIEDIRQCLDPQRKTLETIVIETDDCSLSKSIVVAKGPSGG